MPKALLYTETKLSIHTHVSTNPFAHVCRIHRQCYADNMCSCVFNDLVCLHAGVDLGLTDCGTADRDVTATQLLLLQKDDAWATYTLPFDLPSYGMKYNLLGVNSNGYVTFGAPTSAAACASSNAWLTPGVCVPNGGAAAVFFDGRLPTH